MEENINQKKRCLSCGEERNLMEDFYKKKKQQAYPDICSICIRTQTAEKLEPFITVAKQVCIKCNQEQSLVESFYVKDEAKRYGKICKNCTSKTYYSDPDLLAKAQQQGREYYHANKESLTAKVRKKYADRTEEEKQAAAIKYREWYVANKEEVQKRRAIKAGRIK